MRTITAISTITVARNDLQRAPSGVFSALIHESIASCSTALEIEVVDIAGIECGRRSENDLALRADGALAEFARIERLALLAADRARRERRGRIAGEIAQLVRVPQLESLHGAVLHERAHLVRRAETGHRHLAL